MMLTRDFAATLGLAPGFTPVRSPQSNGMSGAFVKTLKRDDVRITPLPDVRTVIGLLDGWIADYNTIHPHSARCMRSPAEFAPCSTPTELSGEGGHSTQPLTMPGGGSAEEIVLHHRGYSPSRPGAFRCRKRARLRQGGDGQ